jgi:hypothetical protein
MENTDKTKLLQNLKSLSDLFEASTDPEEASYLNKKLSELEKELEKC